jgi:hypothetical protein
MLRPRIWAVILSAIAKPAASSAALLICLPEESRSIAVFNSAPEAVKDLCAFNDATFVFMTKLITSASKKF